MNGVTIMLISLAVLLLAYILYGRWIAKKWGVDPKRKTPAYEQRDGVDYEPAPKSVVFGHQFASIAGAGPINGPIQAAIFGWVPVLLWVLIGGVFFGAVQDFAAMYASVRNKGRSIGYIIEKYIGKTGKKMFLLFCWLFCILVVAAFADIVAGTFMGFTVTDGVQSANITANGAVATTSVMFIVFAVALGLILKYAKLPTAVNTAIAIVMLVASIIIGLKFPMFLSLDVWHIFVFVYILIASVVPVWILLQPRDYLNSYLLVAMIVAAVIGVFVANPQINLPAFVGFEVDGSYLFPILFVTIACGAVSGFHSLVSSGTASKQIKNEKDMLPVSFGSMLLESMLAVIALIAVASFASGEAAAQDLHELHMVPVPAGGGLDPQEHQTDGQDEAEDGAEETVAAAEPGVTHVVAKAKDGADAGKGGVSAKRKVQNGAQGSRKGRFQITQTNSQMELLMHFFHTYTSIIFCVSLSE